MSERGDDELAQLAALDITAPPIGSSLEAKLVNLEPVAPRRPMRELTVIMASAGCYAALLLVVLSTRRDLREIPVAWVVGVATAWLLGFVAAAYFALVPRRGSLMPRWRPAAALTIVASSAFVSLGLLVHPSGPSSLYYGWERFGHGHACLELGLATALVPVIVGAWFLRGSTPVRSRWIAAALGAGCGCVGGFVLHLYCRIADGPHIGLIHGGVVGCAAVISALVIPRVTDPRS